MSAQFIWDRGRPRPHLKTATGKGRGLKNRRPSAVRLLLAIAIAFPAFAFAHPLHTSIAEADYNRTTRQLEVAVRVFADDFEAALGARSKKKISLEKTPAAELDALSRAYLAEHFNVKSRDGVPAVPRWVGRDLKDSANELWLFFEVPLPGGIDGVTIRHALLMDRFSDQLNSVHVRDGPRKLTLVFFPDRGAQLVRLK